MKIQIRTSGVPDTTELRDHVERRLEFALGRFAALLDSIVVHIEDLNGPRGGVDLRCRVVVGGTRIGRLQAELTSAELRAAIDGAAARIGRSVTRALDRRRSLVTGRRRETARLRA